MKFGLRYCNIGPYADPHRAIELVQAAEEAGFDSAWTVEHTVVPGGYQSIYPYSPTGRMPAEEAEFVLPDPLIWPAYVAADIDRPVVPVSSATGLEAVVSSPNNALAFKSTIERCADV